MTAAFLGLEAALYAVFLTMDLTGGSGDPVKYASIAVCLVFSVLFACRGGSRLMPAAMALTLGADTFLLLLNDHYGAGVALFCGVQALYLVRICRRNGGRTLWPLRLALVLAAALAGLFGILAMLGLVIWYLCTIDSDGVAYMAPFVDSERPALWRTLLRRPQPDNKFRPPEYGSENRRRQR